ncbi:MAG: DMT family transporter [Prevotella sp.]|nr:DMT family transporter [Prevotella sp.]
MSYLGEWISIGVAFSWTATALLSEYGSKRMGNLVLNVLRMALSLLFSLPLLAVFGGGLLPQGMGAEACGWMLLSGLVGYVVGDYCLFQCYIVIGSRYGQLFMTLAPLAAAVMAWVALGQRLQPATVAAMLVTLAGIGISVLGRGRHHRVALSLPVRGVLFAVAAAVCQGVGLVLSKIGMDHYPPDTMPAWVVPFSANSLRQIAGLAGFVLLLLWRERSFMPLRHALSDRRDMTVATLTTIFGPFVGVGFSLMAVQYTAAGIASTLMAMTPVIIILPSWWLFRQPVTWRAVAGAVISVVGVSMFFLA